MAHKLVRAEDGSLSLEHFEREQIPAHLMPKSFAPAPERTHESGFWFKVMDRLPAILPWYFALLLVLVGAVFVRTYVIN